MNKTRKLTKKQEKTLIFIKKYIAKNDFPPTIREIAKGTNLSSPATVHAHLKNLIDKEYIKRNPNNNRIIELLVPNEFIPKITDTITIPLFSNIFPQKTITIPKNLSPDKDLVSFQIDDNNIFDNKIEKNDIIILEKTNFYNNEKTLLIKLNNELLIRNIEKEENTYKIYTTNKDESLSLTNITIIGKPISMYRKF